MKGLLLKEWYQSAAYGKTLLIASLAMFAVSAVTLHDGGKQGVFLVYACFLMGIFPMTLLAYDESYGWTMYSYAFPVSPAQLTGVKYLTGLLCTLLSTVFAIAVLAVFGGGLDRGYITFLMTESVTAPLISNSVLLPLSYRFGSTKARYLYFVIIALFAGLLGFGISSDDMLGHAGADVPLPALLGVVVAAVVIYALSWKLSTVWYGKSRDV